VKNIAYISNNPAFLFGNVVNYFTHTSLPRNILKTFQNQYITAICFSTISDAFFPLWMGLGEGKMERLTRRNPPPAFPPERDSAVIPNEMKNLIIKMFLLILKK
jgi:hypothetical protein